ncbi:MAG: hypothetical protein J5933_01125 [Clostridia bacterium]|nr:hypothetical protein [Clostridia bacterium]
MPNRIRGTNISIDPDTSRPSRSESEKKKQEKDSSAPGVSSKRSVFRKGLLIYTCILAVIIIVILTVLWIFLAAYERSLPESEVKRFATEDASYELLEKDAVSRGIGKDTLGSLFDMKIRGKTITYSRKAGEHTSDTPVYTLLADGNPFYTVYLEEGDGLGFGMNGWKLKEIKVSDDFYSTETHTLTVIARDGLLITVNGMLASGFENTKTEKIKFSDFNPYDSSADDLKLVKYEIDGFFSPPEVIAVSEDYRLTPDSRSDYEYLFVGVELSKFSVSAPSGAILKVNGVTVGAGETESEETYQGLTVFEEGRTDIPSECLYVFRNMTAAPDISAEYSGIELKKETDGKRIVFAYPDELMHSFSIYVPSGASLRINGVTAGEQYLSASSEVPEDYRKYDSAFGNARKFDLYTVTGLYKEPEEISAEHDGIALDIVRFTDETGEVSAYYASRPGFAYDTEFVLSAVKQYIVYTAYGYQNVETNYQDLLDYIYPSSPAYTTISSTYSAIKWNSPLTNISYKELKVDNPVDIGGGSFTCEVICRVDLSSWAATRHYSNVIRLTCVSSSYGMKIWDMMILQTSE